MLANFGVRPSGATAAARQRRQMLLRLFWQRWPDRRFHARKDSSSKGRNPRHRKLRRSPRSGSHRAAVRTSCIGAALRRRRQTSVPIENDDRRGADRRSEGWARRLTCINARSSFRARRLRQMSPFGQAIKRGMKTDVESPVPPPAPRVPPGGVSGLLQPVPPVAAIVPLAAGKPAFAAEIAAAPAEKFNLVRDLSLFARVLRRAEGGRLVLAIYVASIAVTIANMLAQVRLNVWNGQFFDAVGRKDLSAFIHLLWTFIAIIAVLLALTV